MHAEDQHFSAFHYNSTKPSILLRAKRSNKLNLTNCIILFLLVFELNKVDDNPGGYEDICNTESPIGGQDLVCK